MKYSRKQLCRIHGLRLDASNQEIESARTEWFQRIDAQLRDFAWSHKQRLDAGETAIIAKQLEHQFNRLHEKKYPEYKARLLVPNNSEANTGADTWQYTMWDAVGMAKIISDFADDLPRVAAFGEEYVGKFASLGDAYDYSIQDLRASAMSGNRLEERKAIMARRAIESKADQVFAFGDAQTGLTGFVNNPNVPVVSAGITGGWASATPAQMLADLRIVQRYGPANTQEVFSYDTLVLPTDEYDIAANTELALVNGALTTVLQQFLSTSPYIRNVESWHKLNTANAAGTGPRMCMYKRDPEVIELIESQPFEQFPPQIRNMSWVVNCHNRVGGTKIVYPLAMAYCDLE